MRSPFASPQLLLFILALALLLAFVQVGLLSIAFEKLGLSPGSAFLLLYGSLFGSAVNVPLFTLGPKPPPTAALPYPLRRLLHRRPRSFDVTTVVAVNLGGCVIPLCFSLYLLARSRISLFQVCAAVLAVTLISRAASRPVPGVGIAMPILIPPVSAALAALLVNPEQAAPLAYISGTLGVLIGADLSRLKDIQGIATPVASIGGAGTFDGIFITGILAVLLA
jgi:uncharacterized membrane protein